MRFIKTTAAEVDEEKNDWDDTEWWLDTARPIPEAPGFIAVQCYKDKDPNDFVKCGEMEILFNDQAEYYFVCVECYFTYRRMQFAGGTRGGMNWRERAEKKLQKHLNDKGWCEFCDPIFGNGGWHLD